MNPEDCKTCRHRHALCYPCYCLGYEADDKTIKANVLDQALDRMIEEQEKDNESDS